MDPSRLVGEAERQSNDETGENKKDNTKDERKVDAKENELEPQGT